ncbi:hypothetical protein B0I35DRAFT_426204 [Stachybotrys elegans]|uniref:Protein kinase domain-containing protein n=1 Tax=Stachybotrys elegans TaxID=80388 RepID=A0A8K0WTB9_9HYPO|nr:hypothetical protein B0I35DRAFT_426204 [Stachybotrys elegans]
MPRLNLAEAAANGSPFDIEGLLAQAEEEQRAPRESLDATRPSDPLDDEALITEVDDTTNMVGTADSWYSDLAWQTSNLRKQAGEPWDFMAMVSTISQVYKRGAYIRMLNLDRDAWVELGRGGTFHVSSATHKISTILPKRSQDKETISQRLVWKRTFGEHPTSADIRSFIGELRVLDHFQAHPFIVDLCGIGWFEAQGVDRHELPKPAILLEEATSTLDSILSPDYSLSLEDMLRIIAEVGLAIQALHSAKIAHGDVKPANILLFPLMIPRDGVIVKSYTAKLSDFSSAVFDTGVEQPFPKGTEGYMAPEVEVAFRGEHDMANMEAISKTDIWSFGVLSAVLLCGSRAVLKPERTAELRVERICSAVNEVLENSAAEGTILRDVRVLLDKSVQITPASRFLDPIVSCLRAYHRSPHQAPDHPGQLHLESTSRLMISYENFKHVRGPIKEYIVKELEVVVNKQDARVASALWELGLLYLSRYADPDASISRGLEYVRQSADLGDVRAQCMAHRLHEAFQGQKSPEISGHIWSDWLLKAARNGSLIAAEELSSANALLAQEARASYAASCYEVLYSDEGEPRESSSMLPNRKSTRLHQAAATGDLSLVKSLLANTSINIDARDADGDTPLLSSCRFGQPDTALLLLRSGADASLTNNRGENGLHLAWCFDDARCESVVNGLITGGASLWAEALSSTAAADMDILPIVSGTPLQRAAARRRLDLVFIFQRYENTMEPSNGNKARRIFLYALRLHDTRLLEYMIDFCRNHPSSDSRLVNLTDTKWFYQGTHLSLPQAACAGWVSGHRNGCDLPLQIWLACSFGGDWEKVLQDSLQIFVDFYIHEQETPGPGIDKAILWAFEERYHDTFERLYHLRIRRLKEVSVLANTTALRWEFHDAINVAVIPPQEAYLIDLMFWKPSRGTLAQQALLSGDRSMFRLLTRRYRANTRLPAPTPTPSKQYIEGQSVLGKKMNLYSVLAYTFHRDLWFAKELRSLELALTCPWEAVPIQSLARKWKNRDLKSVIYLPPLLHAVGTRFWAYASWLIESGASLEEKVTSEVDVLGAVMATRSIDLISFFFKGCQSDEQGAMLVPAYYKAAGGYFVFRTFYETRHLSLKMKNPSNCPDSKETDTSDKTEKPRKREMEERRLECFSYLLRKYPETANSVPGPKLLGIIPSQQVSILRQAGTLGVSETGFPEVDWFVDIFRHLNDLATVHSIQRTLILEPTTYLRLVITAWANSKTPFPNQHLLSYFWGSPLDKLGPLEVDDLLRIDGAVNFLKICPSICWPWFAQYLALIGVFSVWSLYWQRIQALSNNFHTSQIFHEYPMRSALFDFQAGINSVIGFGLLMGIVVNVYVYCVALQRRQALWWIGYSILSNVAIVMILLRLLGAMYRTSLADRLA